MRLLLAIFLIIPFTARCEIYDKIIAVVNGEPITLSEIGAVDLFKRSDDLNSFNTLVKKVEEAIEYTLILQEASRLHINVTDDDVEKSIQSILRRNRITEEQLKKALENEGVTYKIYKKMIKARLAKARILSSLIKPKILVKKEEVEKFYREHMDKYRTEEKRKVFQIFTDDVDKIVKAYDLLKKGVPFKKVAEEYGDFSSFNLGYVKKGELIEPLNSVIFTTPLKGFSKPFKTKYGYHIVYIDEVVEGKPIPFEKIKKKVESDYYDWALKKEYEKWLDKIRKASFIELKI